MKSIYAIHSIIKLSLRKNKICVNIYRMPGCKNTKPENIDDVIVEISTAEEEFKEMLSDNDEEPEKVEM